MLSRFKTALVIASLAICLPASSYGIDFKAQFEPFVTPFIENGDVVGMVVGVSLNGERQILGYGEVSKGSGIKPDGNTLYEIGSVTKVFTTLVLADLVKRGELRLYTPVNELLPPDVQIQGGIRPITLLDLATQSSGLPRLPDNLSSADRWDPYADYTRELLFAFLKGYEPKTPPGQYGYSNLGMGLLGLLLSDHLKQPYEQMIVVRVCDPLQLNSTRVELTGDLAARLAPGYNPDLEEVQNWHFDALAGAGALRSCANDLLRFGEASMSYDIEPLGAAFELAQREYLKPETGSAVGLGWHISEDAVTRWHNGGTGGYASWLSVNPEDRLAVVVVCNTSIYEAITTLGEQLTQLAIGMDVNPPKRRRIAKVPEQVLETYVGTYDFGPGVAMKVSLHNGGLWAQLTGQEEFRIYAESESKFFYKIVDAQLTFVRASDGSVQKLILHQAGLDQEATRK